MPWNLSDSWEGSRERAGEQTGVSLGGSLAVERNSPKTLLGGGAPVQAVSAACFPVPGEAQTARAPGREAGREV